jgi:hypothetical protein
VNVSRELLSHLDKRICGKHELDHSNSTAPSTYRLVDHENKAAARADLLNLGQTFAEHFGEAVAVEIVDMVIRLVGHRKCLRLIEMRWWVVDQRLTCFAIVKAAVNAPLDGLPASKKTRRG